MAIIGPIIGIYFLSGWYSICLKGTRESLLKDITSWATDFKKPPIYWLNGLAGTGKSAIAYDILEIVRKGLVINASFFCTRYSKGQNQIKPKVIFRELTIQLARMIPKFWSKLRQVVKSKLDCQGNAC